MNGKRMVITVTLLALSAVAASQGQSSHSSQNLPGTFVVTVNFEGTSFKVLENFTHDGRSTVLLPFGPPCCNDTRVGGLGEWIRTGPREFVHWTVADHVLQRCAIQEFHGDECLSILLADVVNR